MKKKKTDRTSLPPNVIQKSLCALFPKRWLERTARETGLIKRLRKLKPVAFFWTLVLSYGVETQRSLASLKRGYEKQTRMTLSDGSWYDRFTPELVAFTKACVQHGLAEAGAENKRELSDRLKRFDDVLIKDSSVIQLHEKLAAK